MFIILIIKIENRSLFQQNPYSNQQFHSWKTVKNPGPKTSTGIPWKVTQIKEKCTIMESHK